MRQKKICKLKKKKRNKKKPSLLAVTALVLSDLVEQPNIKVAIQILMYYAFIICLFKELYQGYKDLVKRNVCEMIWGDESNWHFSLQTTRPSRQRQKYSLQERKYTWTLPNLWFSTDYFRWHWVKTPAWNKKMEPAACCCFYVPVIYTHTHRSGSHLNPQTELLCLSRCLKVSLLPFCLCIHKGSSLGTIKARL